MTHDHIIKLARAAGYPVAEYEAGPYVPPMLALLLEQAAAAEREACAALIEGMGRYHEADAIRARGQA